MRCTAGAKTRRFHRPQRNIPTTPGCQERTHRHHKVHTHTHTHTHTHILTYCSNDNPTEWTETKKRNTYQMTQFYIIGLAQQNDSWNVLLTILNNQHIYCNLCWWYWALLTWETLWHFQTKPCLPIMTNLCKHFISKQWQNNFTYKKLPNFQNGGSHYNETLQGPSLNHALYLNVNSTLNIKNIQLQILASLSHNNKDLALQPLSIFQQRLYRDGHT